MQQVNGMCPVYFFILALVVNPAVAQIVSQQEIGPNGCGPCAFVNSLLGSNANALSKLPGESNVGKVQAFIADYGSPNSIPYGSGRSAYSAAHGTTDLDLTAMINRFFLNNKLPKVEGARVVRKKEESTADFVRRVQRILSESISNGFHPIVSIRALAVEPNEKRDRHVWNSKGGHWVAVHNVRNFGAERLAFSIDFSDSLSGEPKTGVVFAETARKSMVPMTFKVSQTGKEQWDWLSNTQTLTLFSPGMPLGTKRAQWNQRAFIAIRYVIHRSSSRGIQGASTGTK